MPAPWKQSYDRLSILKIRDITLPTKVCIFKAMGFPVVMYWHESWTIKKVERLRINAFKLWCWRRLLRVPGTARKIKPVNPKGNQHWIFIGRTDAEAVILWSPGEKSRLIGKNPNAGKDWRQKEKRAAEDEINSFTNSMDMHLSKFQEIVKDREPWCGTVHVVTKSRTWLSDSTTTTPMFTAALFTIARTWKEPKSPLTNE